MTNLVINIMPENYIYTIPVQFQLNKYTRCIVAIRSPLARMSVSVLYVSVAVYVIVHIKL